MALQKDKGFSIANPQEVLPLPEIAFEPHSLGDLEGGDDAAFNLFPAFSDALTD